MSEFFFDEITSIIDDVSVVAFAAGHEVCTNSSIKNVIFTVSSDNVVEVVAGAVDVVYSRENEFPDLVVKTSCR